MVYLGIPNPSGSAPWPRRPGAAFAQSFDPRTCAGSATRWCRSWQSRCARRWRGAVARGDRRAHRRRPAAAARPRPGARTTWSRQGQPARPAPAQVPVMEERPGRVRQHRRRAAAHRTRPASVPSAHGPEVTLSNETMQRPWSARSAGHGAGSDHCPYPPHGHGPWTGRSRSRFLRTRNLPVVAAPGMLRPSPPGRGLSGRRAGTGVPSRAHG
jgi:hypothetical protein